MEDRCWGKLFGGVIERKELSSGEKQGKNREKQELEVCEMKAGRRMKTENRERKK